MSGFSNTLGKAIADATLIAAVSQVVVPVSGSVYVSLHKSAPTDEIAGSDTGEVSVTVDDTAYARVKVDGTTAAGTFTGAEVANVYRASNTAVIDFPAVVYGSGAAPYAVSHFAIWKHASSQLRSNLLYSGALTSTRTLSTGDVLTIAIGELKIDLT